ncbi:hypothetical protein C8J55DRAFT_526332 [Lentinula edodes]|uniref:Uncharacterized protein n=1 Tax=Lentinula lateritia TaxID=40482 RepID=A0A9W9DFW3_9AGAR|nr:hypothetical protein C8J55DRAFT_526332 [Lentinula edodes]
MVRIEQLPGEVCKAIEEFDKFQNVHPYIIAGASVALIIGIEPILSKSFIGMLGMFGFGKMGPVAGPWRLLSSYSTIHIL